MVTIFNSQLGKQVVPEWERLPPLLKNTFKSTNQRRNSIQNAPTRTKLGKPKTDPTMVILAAFYILLTHICSALCLMPRDNSGDQMRSPHAKNFLFLLNANRIFLALGAGTFTTK
jgi:hypothetical protein